MGITFWTLVAGSRVDFESGNGVHGKKFFFAVLVVSIILAFDQGACMSSTRTGQKKCPNTERTLQIWIQ